MLNPVNSTKVMHFFTKVFNNHFNFRLYDLRFTIVLWIYDLQFFKSSIETRALENRIKSSFVNRAIEN